MTAEDAIMNQLRAKNISTRGVSTEEYREVAADPSQRLCGMKLRAPGELTAFQVVVTWRDRTRQQFQVQLRRPGN